MPGLARSSSLLLVALAVGALAGCLPELCDSHDECRETDANGYCSRLGWCASSPEAAELLGPVTPADGGGPVDEDAGVPDDDAGVPDDDAGTPVEDGGGPPTDAGVPDVVGPPVVLECDDAFVFTSQFTAARQWARLQGRAIDEVRLRAMSNGTTGWRLGELDLGIPGGLSGSPDLPPAARTCVDGAPSITLSLENSPGGPEIGFDVGNQAALTAPLTFPVLFTFTPLGDQYNEMTFAFWVRLFPANWDDVAYDRRDRVVVEVEAGLGGTGTVTVPVPLDVRGLGLSADAEANQGAIAVYQTDPGAPRLLTPELERSAAQPSKMVAWVDATLAFGSAALSVYSDRVGTPAVVGNAVAPPFADTEVALHLSGAAPHGMCTVSPGGGALDNCHEEEVLAAEGVFGDGVRTQLGVNDDYQALWAGVGADGGQPFDTIDLASSFSSPVDEVTLELWFKATSLTYDEDEPFWWIFGVYDVASGLGADPGEAYWVPRFGVFRVIEKDSPTDISHHRVYLAMDDDQLFEAVTWGAGTYYVSDAEWRLGELPFDEEFHHLSLRVNRSSPQNVDLLVEIDGESFTPEFTPWFDNDNLTLSAFPQIKADLFEIGSNGVMVDEVRFWHTGVSDLELEASYQVQAAGPFAPDLAERQESPEPNL